MDDQQLKAQAKANPLDTFKYAFEESFLDKLIGRMEDNQEIFQYAAGGFRDHRRLRFGAAAEF